MIKTFTQNDLIRYVYRETTLQENTNIETALLFDESLSDQLNELRQAMFMLDHAEKTPSDRSIDRILSYSKSYDLHSVE